MRHRVVAVAAALSLSVGCAASPPPVEFTDWTIPVPEGTRVIEHEPVPIRERTQRIELVEDLVIRSRGEDERYLLYQAVDIDVGPDGSMYVLDSGNYNVKVFNPQGEHRLTFGSHGEGPGELLRPLSAAIAGDRYVINDNGARLSIWTLDGELIDETRPQVRVRTRPFVGLFDGSVVLPFTRGVGDDFQRAMEERSIRRVYARAQLDDSDPLELLDMPDDPLIMRRGPDGFPTPLRDYIPGAAVSPDGAFYYTNGDEYQVLALDASGSARWALHVPWPRQPYDEEEIDLLLRSMQESDPTVRRSELLIAEVAPTLTALYVDGHGHLYTILRTWVAPDSEPQDRPVDIYAADGSRLFSGFAPSRFYRRAAAQGDFVYDVAFDREADEQTIVRYRLIEPFD